MGKGGTCARLNIPCSSLRTLNPRQVLINFPRCTIVFKMFVGGIDCNCEKRRPKSRSGELCTALQHFVPHLVFFPQDKARILTWYNRSARHISEGGQLLQGGSRSSCTTQQRPSAIRHPSSVGGVLVARFPTTQ